MLKQKKNEVNKLNIDSNKRIKNIIGLIESDKADSINEIRKEAYIVISNYLKTKEVCFKKSTNWLSELLSTHTN